MGPKHCHLLFPQTKERLCKYYRALLTLKLGLLKHLDLANVHIVQRVNGLAGLLNVLANTVRDPGIRKSKRIPLKPSIATHTKT